LPFGIFSVNPGPPRDKKSPNHKNSDDANEVNGGAGTAAPEGPDPGGMIGGGFGGQYQADAVFGEDAARTIAHITIAVAMRFPCFLPEQSE
jgi:hypothetical protein